MTDRDRLIKLIEEWFKEAPTQYLADYLLANGVIVPPCKVGDVVYIKNRPLIISFLHIENEVYYVIQFDCDDCGDCPFYEDDVSFEGEHDCKTMGYIQFTEKDIGKTVFLTKEEAEQALDEPTDSEIVKALECCRYDDYDYCKKCPYRKNKPCQENLIQDAFDLINRLQAKVDLLEETNKQLKNSVDFVKVKDIADLQAENEDLTKACENQQKISMDRYFEIKRLKDILLCFMGALSKVRNIDDIESISVIPLMTELNKGIRAEIKSEAVKEFAELLRLAIVNKPSEFKASQATVDFLNGAAHRQHEILDEINNTLKEWAGEDK